MGNHSRRPRARWLHGRRVMSEGGDGSGLTTCCRHRPGRRDFRPDLRQDLLGAGSVRRRRHHNTLSAGPTPTPRGPLDCQGRGDWKPGAGEVAERTWMTPCPLSPVPCPLFTGRGKWGRGGSRWLASARGSVRLTALRGLWRLESPGPVRPIGGPVVDSPCLPDRGSDGG